MMEAFKRYYIFTTLFFTGAAVMVVELFGTRVIAPYYGSGLYVWSSLITVTMVALSIGYWLGGRLADRSVVEEVKGKGKSNDRGMLSATDKLYVIVFLAGIFILAIPFAAPFILKATSGLGIRGGAMASAALLFTVPLLLLGMVTPYAIKLMTDKLNVVGATSGNLFSISTIGSVAGSLMTGFVLIPNMGTRKIFCLQSGLLVALCAIWLLLSRRYSPMVICLPFIAAAVTTAMASNRNIEVDGFKVINKTESFYGQLKVIDKGKKRWLAIDGASHTGINKNTGLSLFPYAYYLEVMNFMRPGAKDALVIGMGGGSLTRRFEQSYGLTVDSVEINSKVVDLARGFFGFNASKGKVHIQDGRTYLLNTEKKYDFVMLDAFVGGDAPPFHLMTKEMFSQIGDVLKDGGILGINTFGFGSGEGKIIPESIFRTLSEAFPNVKAYPSYKDGGFGNIVFLASGDELSLAKKIEGCDIEGVCRLLNEMLAKEVKYSPGQGIAITDDYNPMEAWGVMTSEALRKSILNFLPAEVLTL